jgi:hypothetical protein
MVHREVNLAAFEGKSPEQAASLLLREFSGVARKAEAEAWRLWERFAGGEPGRRTASDSDGAQFFSQVALAIAEGKEDPAVPRTYQSVFA